TLPKCWWQAELHRDGSRSRVNCLDATPRRGAFSFRCFAFGHFESCQRGHKLLHTGCVEVHCGSVFVPFDDSAIAVLGVTNILSGFKVHIFPFCSDSCLWISRVLNESVTDNPGTGILTDFSRAQAAVPQKLTTQSRSAPG